LGLKHPLLWCTLIKKHWTNMTFLGFQVLNILQW